MRSRNGEDLPICTTCGVQYDAAQFDPASCRICADDRQYIGWQGQQWTSVAQLARDGHRTVVRWEAAGGGDQPGSGPGVWGLGTEPATGIGQRALLIPTEQGNLMWDATSLVDDASVAAVRDRGGLAAIAVSHPHFYASMVAWSDAFGGVPIYVHEADRRWVCREGNVVFWSGDTQQAMPGLTLVNCGVHFPGGTVLHWDRALDGRGALCTGDIIMVVMDRRWVSFMYSYPNLIPEHPEVITRAVDLLEPLRFDAIFGGWWGRVVAHGAKDALITSAQRYLRHTGWPGTRAAGSSGASRATRR